jgi:hypothetical protein
MNLHTRIRLQQNVAAPPAPGLVKMVEYVCHFTICTNFGIMRRDRFQLRVKQRV